MVVLERKKNLKGFDNSGLFYVLIKISYIPVFYFFLSMGLKVMAKKDFFVHNLANLCLREEKNILYYNILY